MTESNMEHPTAGRRRRHKSPPVLHATVALPVSRLADHLDTKNGPSDEEGEKGSKASEIRTDYSYFYFKQTPI